MRFPGPTSVVLLRLCLLHACHARPAGEVSLLSRSGCYALSVWELALFRQFPGVRHVQLTNQSGRARVGPSRSAMVGLGKVLGGQHSKHPARKPGIEDVEAALARGYNDRLETFCPCGCRSSDYALLIVLIQSAHGYDGSRNVHFR